MNDAIYRLGTISVYGFGVLATISFLWGSFVFYKKAVSSHLDEFHILDGVVMSAFWAFMVGRLSYVILNLDIFWNRFSRVFLFSNFPGIDKWGVLVGIFLGAFWTVRRVKGKVFDWFDLISLGISSGIAILFAGLSALRFSWQYLVLSLIYLLFFIFSWGAEDKYRTFGWYKGNKTSSRSGLITGLSISVWGMLSILEESFFNNMDFNKVMWGILLIVGGMVLVYIRSGRTVSEDIKIIFKNGRKK